LEWESKLYVVQKLFESMVLLKWSTQVGPGPVDQIMYTVLLDFLHLLRNMYLYFHYGCVLWCSQVVCIRPYSLNTTIAFYFVN